MTRALAVLVLVLAVAACGSHGPAPEPPKPVPVDTKKLAADLYDDLVKLAEIAHRQRENCDALIGELEAHTRAMQTHAAEVRRAERDAAVAKQLKLDVQAYDDKAAGVSQTIADDLVATYRACGERKEQLRKIIDQIPHSISE